MSVWTKCPELAEESNIMWLSLKMFGDRETDWKEPELLNFVEDFICLYVCPHMCTTLPIKMLSTHK